MSRRFNPALKKLGFQPSDKVVIFHADDLGMAQATLDAYRDLLEVGLLSSASLMLPCAWAPAAAELARAHPQADLGVHLTLTSEWRSYRWGPLSTRDPASGLLDDQGYFPASVTALHAAAKPEAVQTELSAQVRRAQDWGLTLSHIDAHMGAVAHPKYLPGCINMALSARLVTMFPRMNAAAWRAQGFDTLAAVAAETYGAALEWRGLPLVDHLVSLPHDSGGDHAALTRQILRELPPGLTHFILHPACDTPELRAITPGWEGRVANYRAFTDRSLLEFVRAEGVQITSYRELQALLPAS
ncbi:polysaccharide deacetylase family protein [Deinococcus sp.]|uniref:polysaccharide deacetylase family protein n=1 Tax=Deinococcus sp. TaxID=47478 RepID=UPI003CC681C8